MVVRKSSGRRRADARRQSLCRKCLALLAVVAMVVPPLVWEQITSIASKVLKPSVSTERLRNQSLRHGS